MMEKWNKAGSAAVRAGFLLLFLFAAAVQARPGNGQVRPLRVGVYDNPPIVARAGPGRYQGIAIAFLEDVAAREGWRLEYVYGPWSEVYRALLEGRIDLLTGIAHTEARARRLRFTGGTLVSNWGVVYRHPKAEITSLFDLRGQRVAVMRRSIHTAAIRDLLRRFGIEARFLEVDSFAAVLEAVHRGRAVAGVVNRLFGLRHGAAHGVVQTTIVFNPVEVRFAGRQGLDPGILAALDRHLAAQKRDPASTYQQALTAALGAPPTGGLPLWGVWLILGAVWLALVGAGLSMFLRRRVRAQTEALRRERDTAQRYLDTVQVMIVALDRSGRITLANRYACDVLGCTEPELLGQDWFARCLPRDQAAGARRVFRRIVRGELEPLAYHEGRVVTRDGAERLIAWHHTYDRDGSGGVSGVLSSGTDITDRARAEDALRLSEERFAKAFRASPDAIMITRLRDGCILEVNEGFERHAGYAAAEVVGRSTLDVNLYAEPRDRQRLVQQLVETGSVRDFEIWARRKGGARRLVQVSAERIRIGDEECMITVTRDITERKAQLLELEHQASHDSLTGLPNRKFLHRCLDELVGVPPARGRLAALMLMDLDRFKEINDTLGHQAGDRVLKEVARRLQAYLESRRAVVARLGGDEFAVLLEDLASTEAAETAARAILAEVRRPYGLEGLKVSIGGSLGIALYPAHAGDGSGLLRCADVAMYVAKREGRGYSVYHPDLDDHSPRRLALSTELGLAIRAHQLALHYQPKVALASGAVTGVEALVRWRHPRLGMVPPAQFVPLAEASGLIVPLTQWVLDHALRQVRRWGEQGRAVRVAVNLSPRMLLDTGLPEDLGRRVERSGVGPAALELEITEGAIMADPDRARQILTELHAMGLRLSIDDFGTGYSSLAYLKSLPIDALKIDLTFVRNMTRSEQDAIIVTSIIQLAHNLGLEVIAEGVEDAATLEALQAAGCDEVQGYHISRPLRAAALATWLTAAGGGPAALAGGRRG